MMILDRRVTAVVVFGKGWCAMDVQRKQGEHEDDLDNMLDILLLGMDDVDMELEGMTS